MKTLPDREWEIKNEALLKVFKEEWPVSILRMPSSNEAIDRKMPLCRKLIKEVNKLRINGDSI